MASLLNDVIVKNGIIEHISSLDRPIVFFPELTFKRFLFIVLLPLIIFIALAFILKKKYDAKKAKDDIILTGFYDFHDDNDLH